MFLESDAWLDVCGTVSPTQDAFANSEVPMAALDSIANWQLERGPSGPVKLEFMMTHRVITEQDMGPRVSKISNS